MTPISTCYFLAVGDTMDSGASGSLTMVSHTFVKNTATNYDVLTTEPPRNRCANLYGDPLVDLVPVAAARNSLVGVESYGVTWFTIQQSIQERTRNFVTLDAMAMNKFRDMGLTEVFETSQVPMYDLVFFVDAKKIPFGKSGEQLPLEKSGEQVGFVRMPCRIGHLQKTLDNFAKFYIPHVITSFALTPASPGAFVETPCPCDFRGATLVAIGLNEHATLNHRLHHHIFMQARSFEATVYMHEFAGKFMDASDFESLTMTRVLVQVNYTIDMTPRDVYLRVRESVLMRIKAYEEFLLLLYRAFNGRDSPIPAPGMGGVLLRLSSCLFLSVSARNAEFCEF